MSEIETSPTDEPGTKKKTDHRSLVVMIGFLLALVFLVALNMN